jgi:integrase
MKEADKAKLMEEGLPLGEEEQKIYKTAREEIEAELKPEIREIKAKEKKLPAVLSREECQELIRAYKKGKLASRNNLLLRLLYATGMRVEELEGLRFCDLNWDRGTIFIRSGKGGKDRYVCADKETFEGLKRWQRGKRLEDSIPGVKKRQLRRIVERAGELTGVSEKYEAMDRVFSTHSFRHAFATHLYEGGMSIFAIKKLLGHEFLTTTELYINCTIEQARKEYEEVGLFEEI